ncbi:hypothetical protein N9F34_04425 [Alphaproteobacteria bacterium]|nr:hypothetical protein [Alphaproteobacteria bacterium]
MDRDGSFIFYVIVLLNVMGVPGILEFLATLYPILSCEEGANYPNAIKALKDQLPVLLNIFNIVMLLSAALDLDYISA